MTAVTPGREALADRLQRVVDKTGTEWAYHSLITEAINGLRLAAKPDDEGVREADGSTDEKALVLVMNVLQRIADTALAGFKEDGIDESSALSSINNITRDAIDALAKRRLSTTGEPKR